MDETMQEPEPRLLHTLQRIDAREVWGHEARHFTPWLETHIEELNSALGFDIEITAREQSVGAFAVDLFGNNVQTGEPVVIENQLEPTNHSHLGQLVTYAAGSKAKTILWIAPQFREEHREAMRWLNDLSPEDVGFFGIEVEILEINGQRAANFKLVAEPNTWQKTASTVARSSEHGTPSDLRLMYQSFFAELLAELKRRAPSATSAATTQPQSWFQMSAGVSGCHFAWSFVRENRLKVELRIDFRDQERNFGVLQYLQQTIEPLSNVLSEPVEWDFSRSRRSQSLAIFWPTKITVQEATDNLDDVRDWAVTRMMAFMEHFRPLLRQLPSELPDSDNHFDRDSLPD